MGNTVVTRKNVGDITITALPMSSVSLEADRIVIRGPVRIEYVDQEPPRPSRSAQLVFAAAWASLLSVVIYCLFS